MSKRERLELLRRSNSLSALMSRSWSCVPRWLSGTPNLGDPLAGFVIIQLNEATTAMKSEKVAGCSR